MFLVQGCGSLVVASSDAANWMEEPTILSKNSQEGGGKKCQDMRSS